MIVGIGTDVCEIDRMSTALARTPSIRPRLFTAAEQADCAEAAARLAGRFAAKEAVAKALGSGIRFPWTDIEVLPDPLGRPVVTLRGGAAAVAEQAAITSVHVSISTARTLAVATAIAETA